MTIRIVETLVAVTTLAAVTIYLVSSWPRSHLEILTLIAVWGIWLGTIHAKSEYAKYAVSLCLLLPTAGVIHLLLEQNFDVALLALPPLVRTFTISTLLHRILNGCTLILHDIRQVAGDSSRRPVDDV